MVIVLPNRLHTHSLNKYLSSASYASSILLDVGNKEKKKKDKAPTDKKHGSTDGFWRGDI